MSDFANHIAALRALGGRRVWSLMVSLFGDLAQAEGQTIDGPILSSIMGALQVKPEAVRVALHRLRNEGWLTSTKSGRISRHALTVQGRSESAAASPRIYALPGGADAEWKMVLTEDSTPEIDARFVAIAPRIYVGPAYLPLPLRALHFVGGDVLPWLQSQAEPMHLRGEYRALQRTLETLIDALPPPQDLSVVETAALRCLIVHNWRRLVLKHPALPTALVSPDWPGHKCHVSVADLLASYPRPDLRNFDQQNTA